MFEKVAIPRKYHRILLGDKSIFIHDIENKTNCKFRFPDKETASDVISIFGPESQVHIAATMLLVRYSQLEDITLETKTQISFYVGSCAIPGRDGNSSQLGHCAYLRFAGFRWLCGTHEARLPGLDCSVIQRQWKRFSFRLPESMLLHLLVPA